MNSTTNTTYKVTCTLGTEIYSRLVAAPSKAEAIEKFRDFLLTGNFRMHPMWSKAKFRAKSGSTV